MIQMLLEKVFGTQNARTLKKIWPIVEKINGLEKDFEKLSGEELKARTVQFRERLSKGETLDDILPEAFAAVRESARRTVGMRHFDVQLLGGVILHRGNIAEMSTGEGKTLVATLPVYLNALSGKGVHVVTVNDYLARRDRDWMAPVYENLGLRVGAIQHDMPPPERREAYLCDITYGTNNEFGFDYLRDNMVVSLDQRVQRELNFAIVDEVDSILIDEARTPLIISGAADESTDKYYRVDRIIPRLKEEDDYKKDEKAHNVSLTEDGIRHCEELLGVDNLYENTHIDLIHHINQGLRAHVLFKRDRNYVVKDDEVIIVDEFTGRLMPGRRFSDGLHQALEAKEGVRIRRENQTLATVTFQNYFRMYDKLAGMTGTAATEAVEFEKIYKLEVVVMPTNRPCIRKDQSDGIFRTNREKNEAVVEEIVEQHKNGRPVLVGTISIEHSEQLSHMLDRYNCPHSVLNAKYHEKEAEIISRAGQEGAVTIATNMAGRGTDIVLGDGIADKGGLYVLGTERHESRRIDNQLRGRCGRQGDPGESKFFISLEDDLMRIFGSDRISGVMQKLGMEDGEEIQHPLVTKAIETAQKRVETRNFEIRKHLLDYDDVMNRQRELIYAERDRILKGTEVREHLMDMIEDRLETMVSIYAHPDANSVDYDLKGLTESLNTKLNGDFSAVVNENGENPEELLEALIEAARIRLSEKEKDLTEEKMKYLSSYVLLQVIDSKWKDHLHRLDNLKEGIGLRAYGQRDPLIEYKKEAFMMFEEMVDSIKEDAIELIFRMQVVREEGMSSVLSDSKANYEHPESEGLGRGQMRAAPGEGGPSPAGMSGMFGGMDAAPGPSPAKQADTVRRETPKVGRNDPCPCGSGRKYKKCCGIND